jgi:hypothetical protein
VRRVRRRDTPLRYLYNVYAIGARAGQLLFDGNGVKQLLHECEPRDSSSAEADTRMCMSKTIHLGVANVRELVVGYVRNPSMSAKVTLRRYKMSSDSSPTRVQQNVGVQLLVQASAQSRATPLPYAC